MNSRLALKDKTVLLAQAIIDSFPYPVWISDGDRNVMLNDSAKDVAAQGLSLDEPKPSATDDAVCHRGKNFVLRKRDLNHGTNCVLNELQDVDEPTRRMRAVSDNLAKAFIVHNT